MTDLDPKALAAARKRVERMIHANGFYGHKITISSPPNRNGNSPVTAAALASEIITAYLHALPPQSTLGETEEPTSQQLYDIRRPYFDTIETLLRILKGSPLTAEQVVAVDKIAKEHSWDGLSCYCGGGWLVGHRAGCPEAAPLDRPGADRAGWRLIADDPPPTDGNPFLCGWWNADHTYWWTCKAHWANGAIDGGWDGAREPIEVHPTHWRPLPEPPALSSKESR